MRSIAYDYKISDDIKNQHNGEENKDNEIMLVGDGVHENGWRST